MLDRLKLKAKIVEKDTSIERLSKEIGIDVTTFYRKMRNNTFLVKEVDAIAAALALTREEALSIFFAQ